MFRMVVRRVKVLLSWLLAIVVVILLVSGAWWLLTVMG